MTRGTARSWTIIWLSGLVGWAGACLNNWRRATSSSDGLAASATALLRTGTFQWGRCVTLGGYFFALKNRTVFGPFKQVRFFVVRYLKLGNNLLAEAGSSYVDCYTSDALPCHCRNKKRILDGLTGIRYFEHLLTENRVYNSFRFDLMTANQHNIR